MFLMIHWYNNTFSLFIKNKFYGIQTFKISCLLDAPKIKRQSTPDNARAGRLTWWGFGWTRWWSSRSVCPSLCPSVRWSCSRSSVRSYGGHSCQTLPFYQLPVLIYNTDLPYCVCDEIFVQPEFMPKHAWKQSIRPENHSRNEVIFSIGWEAFVFGFTPLHDV